MGNYAIAYQDKNGIGFSKNQPFIEFFDRKCESRKFKNT